MLAPRSGYLIALLTIHLGVTCPLRAQEKAPAKTYEIDTSASRVYIKVGSASLLGHPHGVEGNLKAGKITFGGAGEMVFDMASFSADTAAARKYVGLGDKKVTENEAKKVTTTMRSNEVLDVTQYPTATYQITSITPMDKQTLGEPGNYKLTGTFSLHGREQKVPITAKVEKGNKPGILIMSGTFSIKQTDYGITPFSAAGGLAKVADELQIYGELVLTAK